MYELAILIFNICLFKKAPQDIPYSYNLFKLLFIISFAINFLLLALYSSWLVAFLQALLGLLLILVFSYGLLFFSRKLARFYQTSSALLGADALMSFFALPAIATAIVGQNNALVSLAMLGIIIWHWTVVGHIIRNALEQGLSFSLGLAFLYQLGAYQLMALLFPEVASAN